MLAVAMAAEAVKAHDLPSDVEIAARVFDAGIAQKRPVDRPRSLAQPIEGRADRIDLVVVTAVVREGFQFVQEHRIPRRPHEEYPARFDLRRERAGPGHLVAGDALGAE